MGAASVRNGRVRKRRFRKKELYLHRKTTCCARHVSLVVTSAACFFCGYDRSFPSKTNYESQQRKLHVSFRDARPAYGIRAVRHRFLPAGASCAGRLFPFVGVDGTDEPDDRHVRPGRRTGLHRSDQRPLRPADAVAGFDGSLHRGDGALYRRAEYLSVQSPAPVPGIYGCRRYRTRPFDCYGYVYRQRAHPVHCHDFGRQRRRSGRGTRRGRYAAGFHLVEGDVRSAVARRCGAGGLVFAGARIAACCTAFGARRAVGLRRLRQGVPKSEICRFSGGLCLVDAGAVRLYLRFAVHSATGVRTFAIGVRTLFCSQRRRYRCRLCRGGPVCRLVSRTAHRRRRVRLYGHRHGGRSVDESADRGRRTGLFPADVRLRDDPARRHVDRPRLRTR